MLQFVLHIIIMTCIFLFVVLGYNFVFGKGKILHFGQAGQGLVATYGMWVLVMQFDWSFWPALLVSAVLTTLLALAFTALSFRLEPDGLGVMSIALHLALFSVVLNWHDVTRGPLGLPGIPRSPFPHSQFGFALVAVIAVILWILLLKKLSNSSIGRGLDALSEHEWHAESLGIQRKKIHMIAFIVAGFGSLLSNVFNAPYLFLVAPADYYFPTMVLYVMCVSAGGPGSLRGVTIATILIVLLREGLRFIGLPAEILGPVRLMLFGAILFAAVWWRRDTMFPQQRSV